jgi:thioredoxin 1
MSNAIEITDNEFNQAVFQAKKPVLVYFWAAWCGPCRLVSPSINLIADYYGDRLKVVKLEIDPNPNAVQTCQVKGVPALRLYQEGQLLLSHEGAIGKQQLQSMLEKHLS